MIIPSFSVYTVGRLSKQTHKLDKPVFNNANLSDRVSFGSSPIDKNNSKILSNYDYCKEINRKIGINRTEALEEVFGEEFVIRPLQIISVDYVHNLIKEKYNTQNKWYTLEGKQLQDVSNKILDKLDLNNEYNWALNQLSNPKLKSYRGNLPLNVKNLLRQLENTYSYKSYKSQLADNANNEDGKSENATPALSKADFLAVVLNNKIDEYLSPAQEMYYFNQKDEREILDRNDFKKAFTGEIYALLTAFLLNLVSPTANYHTIFSHMKYTYHILDDIDRIKPDPTLYGSDTEQKKSNFDAAAARELIREIVNNNLSKRYLNTDLSLKEQKEISTYIDMTNHKAKQEALSRRGDFQPNI